MKYLYLLSLALLLVLSVVLSSCKNVLAPSGNQIVFDLSKPVTYTQVQALLDQRCSVTGCHDHQYQAGSPPLDLSDQGAFTNLQPPIVWPKDTTRSQIIQWVGFPPNGRLHPADLGFPSLTQNQIQGIEKWIMEGATFTN